MNVTTPDCIIQFQEVGGIVTEAKLGLPRNDARWENDIKQLEKYDDDLVGWWTRDEKIPSHDIVALVPLARAVRFSDYLESGIAERKWEFRRKISVVAFIKTSGVKDFLTLKKERGVLSVSELDARLRESRQIDLALLLTTYNDRKFVDHMPPLPYTLQIIWDHLFSRYAGDKYDQESGKVPSLQVSVEQVTKDLQEYFGFTSSGARSPEIPRASWVRNALDTLVRSKLAVKTGDNLYTIEYKRTRGDTLRKFGKLCFELEQKTKSVPSSQLTFLPASGDTEAKSED